MKPCEHERAKTIKRTHRDNRPISAPVVCRTTHMYGVGRRGRCCQGAVVSSTDEKDEICVRKNLGPTDVALGLAWHR